MNEADARAGRNGVSVVRRASAGTGYRTYEVHQRERVGESTAKVKPAQFLSPAFVNDPYPLLATLRENYPCYRNWLTNAYWITRYDDVTSVFVDDANFETRPKRWFYGVADYGRDFGDDVRVQRSYADYVDAHVQPIAARILDEFVPAGTIDLATDFAGRLPLELLVGWLNLPNDSVAWFIGRYWAIQRGAHWEPRARRAGIMALDELVDFFEPILRARRGGSGTDLVSVVAALEGDGGPACAADLVVTLLEWDHTTLHGVLANLWWLLLLHPQALAHVRAEPRAIKRAYLETLRHSTPVLAAQRFARHEVERFGRLLPQGALVVCSAAAANRDPRVFADPDSFDIGRTDLCQREPRGQYRADGLASGIAFGLGKPSIHPATPEDRPRSRYAVTRDAAVAASSVLLDASAHIELAAATAALRCLRLHDAHTCWSLPVRLRN